MRAMEEAVPRIPHVDCAQFHQRVRAMYSWENVAERTERVYERIYKQPKLPLIERFRRYGPLNYRTAARTLFLRPHLAHFCPVFRRFFAVFSVLTPGFQKVAPKDRGAVA